MGSAHSLQPSGREGDPWLPAACPHQLRGAALQRLSPVFTSMSTSTASTHTPSHAAPSQHSCIADFTL